MRAAEREPPRQSEVAVSSGSWEPEITNTTAERAGQVTDLLTRTDDRLQGRPAWRVRADRERDWYAVVDELIDDLAVLILSRWPRVDQRSTPVFDPEEHEVTRTVDQLHEVVDGHRERLGQVERPIRIGDAFLVRAAEGAESPAEPESWEVVVDVTDAARDQAKIAYYGAVGHTEAEAVPGADEPRGGSGGEQAESNDIARELDPTSATTESESLDGAQEEQSPSGPGVAPPAV